MGWDGMDEVSDWPAKRPWEAKIFLSLIDSVFFFQLKEGWQFLLPLGIRTRAGRFVWGFVCFALDVAMVGGVGFSFLFFFFFLARERSYARYHWVINGRLRYLQIGQVEHEVEIGMSSPSSIVENLPSAGVWRGGPTA
jgi:hypothetical protein